MRLALTAALTVACAEPPSRPADFAVRDSASITIVEHANVLSADSTSWMLDTTPHLRIGHLESSHAHIFGGIGGMARLSDGRIAIADAQVAEVRFFDSVGAHLTTVGRIGQGPDEYENFRTMRRFVGDSLLVRDYEGLRFNVLTPQGNVVRRFCPSINDSVDRGAIPTLQGVFSDGSILFTDRLNRCRDVTAQGVCTDSLRFTRVRESGAVVTRYGTLASARYEKLRTSTAGLSPRLIEELARAGAGSMSSIALFLPQVHWVVIGNDLYYGDAKEFEIRVLDGAGAVRRLIRVLSPPLVVPRPNLGAPVTAGGSEAYRSELGTTMAEAQSRAQPRAFNGLYADALGYLWVRQIETDSTARTPSGGTMRWLVFDSTGILRQTMRMSTTLGTLHEIGADYMLFSRSNADGVATAVFFPLRRGGTAPVR